MLPHINSHPERLGDDKIKLCISVNDVNNYFVNFDVNAINGIPAPRNNFCIYLRNRVKDSCYVTPVSCNEIIAIVKAMPSKPSCDHNGLSVMLLKLFSVYYFQ